MSNCANSLHSEIGTTVGKAIMIPFNLKYPIERVCIKDAYGSFNEWGENEITSTDWYKYPVSEKVY